MDTYKSSFGNKFVYILSLVVFAITTFPILKGWVPVFSRIWWFEAILLFALIVQYSKFLHFTFIAPLFVYWFILLINQTTGDVYFNDLLSTFTEFMCFVCCMSLTVWYAENAKQKQMKMVILLYGVIVLVTCICSILIFKEMPHVMRTVQFDINSGNKEGLRSFYNKLGLESYEMGHSLPALIPFIVYNIKYRSHRIVDRLAWITFGVADLILVYISSATTALILSFILLFGSLFWGHKSLEGKNIARVLLLTPFLLVIMYFAASYLLNFWSTSANVESIGKAEELMSFLETGETGDAYATRESLYKMTYDAFFSSPIWGVNKMAIGGHQFLMDRMAMLGLLGVIPLMLSLFRFLKFVYKGQRDDVKPYLLLSYFAIVTMMVSKAISGFEYWIIVLFFVPVLAYYTSNARCNE